MFITPSFKKSLIVEQFQGNYLKQFVNYIKIRHSSVPNPPPFFTNHCCLFNLWVLLTPNKLGNLFINTFVKSSGIGRTVAIKVNLENANDFTMLIFPYIVKSLEDHALRHFSKESNLGSKFLL